MRFTITRSWARTFSRTVQSIVTFFFTVSTNSRVILTSVGSPSTFIYQMMQTSWEKSGFITTSHDSDSSHQECPRLNVCLSEQPKTLVGTIVPFLMRRRSLSALFSLLLSNEPQLVMMRIAGISNNFGLLPSVQRSSAPRATPPQLFTFIPNRKRAAMRWRVELGAVVFRDDSRTLCNRSPCSCCIGVHTTPLLLLLTLSVCFCPSAFTPYPRSLWWRGSAAVVAVVAGGLGGVLSSSSAAHPSKSSR